LAIALMKEVVAFLTVLAMISRLAAGQNIPK
jgi:hypothetical protein